MGEQPPQPRGCAALSLAIFEGFSVRVVGRIPLALLRPVHDKPPFPCAAAADSAGAALGHSGQHALSSSDLAGGMDDVRSGSSVAALQDELAEKNRIIERLQVGPAARA